mgnify:CR=1 FL=1
MQKRPEKELEILQKAKSETSRFKRMRKRRPRFLTPIIIVISIVLVTALGVFVTPLGQNALNTLLKKSDEVPVLAADMPVKTAESEIIINENSESFNGIALQAESDFPDLNANSIYASFLKARELGFNTVYLDLNYKDDVLSDELLSAAINAAQRQSLKLFGVLDVSGYKIQDENLLKTMVNTANLSGISGMFIKNIANSLGGAEYSDYLSSGYDKSFEEFNYEINKGKIKAFVMNYKKETSQKYLGLFAEGAFDAAAHKSLAKGGVDTADLIASEFFDCVIVENLGATDSAVLPFAEMVQAYCDAASSSNTRTGFMLYSSKIQTEYKNPDQLTRELMVLADSGDGILCFDSLTSLVKDTTGAADTALKYMVGNLKSYTPKGLTFSSPKDLTATCTESSIAISGASDPQFALTVDGKAVERTKDGYFSYQQSLKVGVNKFTFSHKGTTKTLKITYKYIVIKNISPSSALTLDGGTQIVVKAVARAGAAVKASFNGNTITLTRVASSEEHLDVADSDFADFAGSFTMPASTAKTQHLGRITFKATYNGQSGSMSSGKITIKKVVSQTSSAAPSSTASSAKPVVAGTRTLATVTAEYAETFTGTTTDDYSNPKNAYLPKGTTDYVSDTKIYNGAQYYYKMDCGVRVYAKNVSLSPKTKKPQGTDVSVNNCVTSGHYTVINITTPYRMPIGFDVLPQSYTNIAAKDYTISKVTFTYIELKLHYATSLSNTSAIGNNPLFSRVETIKSGDGYVLRFHLKKTGGFYGYTATYTADNNLRISFLNPQSVSGNSLSGIRICVDAGHGGSDYGATVKDNKNKTIKESELNLILAKKLQTRLQNMGATVIMTRTSDESMEQAERIRRVRNSAADFGISIHRNASESAKPSAFNAYHFNAWTKTPADKVYNAVAAQNLYTVTKWSGVKSHVFYLSRISSMPFVLTENGFMTNANELQKITTDEFNNKCADALAAGILNYFKAQ